jgi:hypothetical protein
MKAAKKILAFALVMSAAAVSHAHHSYIIYDGEDYRTISGIFVKDRFRGGGHAHFFVDVTTPDGKVVTWKVESLTAGRWKEEWLEFLEVADIGQEITVTGWPMRSGRPILFLHTMTGNASGRNLEIDNRIVPAARDFSFGENEVNPVLAADLPEQTPDGQRVFTEEGYLTRAGERMLEERTGKRTMTEEQRAEREAQRARDRAAAEQRQAP